MSLVLQKKPIALLVLAAAAAASMWFYVRCISVPRQVQDGAQLERPRGNLSDLYPRWLGARELLLHGRDPYSPEVTREIQRGYYGREIDPARPNDPKDQSGFAYPVYVVFLLAPTVHMDFATVRWLAAWLFTGLTLVSVPMWGFALGASFRPWQITAVILLLLGSYPFIEAVALQQPVLLVAALLAGSFFLRRQGNLAASGILMAVATIKPQVAWLPVALMLMWVGADWRTRQRWFWGFASTLLVSLGAAEAVLPGWLSRFYSAVHSYQSYMAGTSFLDWLVTPRWSGVAALCVVVPVLWMGWKARQLVPEAEPANRATCLALVAAVCTSPNLALYNQVLLLPGILFWFGGPLVGRPLVRYFNGLFAALLAWPWVACWVLIFAKEIVRAESFVHRAWQLPLYATLSLPVLLLVLLLLAPSTTVASERTFPASEKLA